MTRRNIHTRIAVVVAAALALVACADGGSTSSVAPVAPAGDCADIQARLDDAKNDALEAKNTAYESSGTPDGPEDAEKAAEAEAVVDLLIEEEAECVSAATSTTTSTSTTTTVATSNTDETTTTSTTTPSTTPSVVPEGDLVVDESTPIPEIAQCDEGNEFNPNSLPSPEKFTSDSVSTKFGSIGPDEMFLEYMAEQCGNPTLLENTVDGFCEGEIVIGDFDVCKENPWMTEYTDLLDELGPTAAFLLKVDGEWVVSAEFQQYAEMANKLLMFYDVRGVEKLRSVRNWHLAGPDGDDLPRVVENDRQEGLPSLILVYTLKDFCPQQTGASVIGFNVNDKRFEIFKRECEPPAEPPCTENCGGGTTVPPTTTPRTTVPGKATPPTTAAQPPITATPPPSTPDGCVDWGGIWYNGECRWMGDDSGPGAPEPEWPSWGPTPTSEPPGSVPSTSTPPGTGTTVAGP